MNKTELKEILYRNFINEIYFEYGTGPIEPGTTIRINWQTIINITEEGAKLLNKQLKDLHEQITDGNQCLKKKLILPDPEHH